MDNATRLKMLRALRPKGGIESFATHRDFVEWQAKVAPLLNFNDFYHSNFIRFSGPASVPGLSSYTYDPLFSQMDNVIVQAITELEHGLTQPAPKPTMTLTNENGMWWFFQHCTTKTRGWILATIIALVGGALSVGYFAGHSGVVSQIIEAWKHR